jgi:hypothetical protein
MILIFLVNLTTNLINVIECLKDLLIIEEIVMATISKIITTSIDLLMTDTVAEMMQLFAQLCFLPKYIYINLRVRVIVFNLVLIIKP